MFKYFELSPSEYSEPARPKSFAMTDKDYKHDDEVLAGVFDS